MADDPRQEVEFTLGGKAYRVRPTFSVLVGVESALDQSCIALGIKIGQGRASVTEIATILAQMVKPEKGPGVSEIGDLLVEEGVRQFYDPLTDFLLRALKGNREHLKEAQSGDKPADPPQG